MVIHTLPRKVALASSVNHKVLTAQIKQVGTAWCVQPFLEKKNKKTWKFNKRKKTTMHLTTLVSLLCSHNLARVLDYKCSFGDVLLASDTPATRLGVEQAHGNRVVCLDDPRRAVWPTPTPVLLKAYVEHRDDKKTITTTYWLVHSYTMSYSMYSGRR